MEQNSVGQPCCAKTVSQKGQDREKLVVGVVPSIRKPIIPVGFEAAFGHKPVTRAGIFLTIEAFQLFTWNAFLSVREHQALIRDAQLFR